MAHFRLQIISQSRVLLDQDVTSIIVPGASGYFGVLSDHAPMLAALGKGTLTVKTGQMEKTFQIEGGFFEGPDNKAIVVPDRIGGLGGDEAESTT